MGTVQYKIIGDENLMEIIKGLPERVAKGPVQKTFRKGAIPYIARVRGNIPSSLNDLKKAVIAKNMKGAAIKVGPYARKLKVKISGVQSDVDAYYPLYWHNYGTYGERDPEHQFKTPRKSKTAKREGGTRPLNFIERAWESTKYQVQQIVDRDMQKNIDDFLKRKANRRA